MSRFRLERAPMPTAITTPARSAALTSVSVPTMTPARYPVLKPVRSPVLRAVLSLTLVVTTALTVCLPASAQQPEAVRQPGSYPGVGRAATAKEVKAWDIDVRPDFRGLPAGSGSVAAGQDIWEAKCASCHGVFGEANEVFSPLVGGTTREDVATGRVARLKDEAYPQRTTLMKVATVSTLWDYINRAMPWNKPKSLSVDEVYAVTAFLLNLGDIVPSNFVLSDRNIADVQKLMPNRNGFSQQHAMWPGRSAVASKSFDVQGSACMKNCVTEPHLASFLPEHARGNHGNLADQNRLVGAQHGAVTVAAAKLAAAESAASSASGGTSGAAAAAKPPGLAANEPKALLARYSCSACHALDAKLVGPSFNDIAARHGARDDAATFLAGRIRAGGSGNWGSVPMPPQDLPEADLKQISQWLAGGRGK